MILNAQWLTSRMIPMIASFMAGVLACSLFSGLPVVGQGQDSPAQKQVARAKTKPTHTTNTFVSGLSGVTVDANWKHDTVYKCDLAFDSPGSLGAYMNSTYGATAYYYLQRDTTSGPPNKDQMSWDLIDFKIDSSNGKLLHLRFHAICPYARDHNHHPPFGHGTGNIIVISTGLDPNNNSSVTQTNLFTPQPTSETPP